MKSKCFAAFFRLKQTTSSPSSPIPLYRLLVRLIITAGTNKAVFLKNRYINAHTHIVDRSTLRRVGGGGGGKGYFK